MKRSIPIQLNQPTEAQIQRAILDWLAAERIWHERRNTGAMKAVHNGKARFTRFGRPGTPDILATQKVPYTQADRYSFQRIIWIEVKGPCGQQTEEQKRFESEVRAEGHLYILARSLDDVISILR